MDLRSDAEPRSDLDPVTSLQRRIEALVRGEESDPFALLGMHRSEGGLVVRAFRPRADTLELVDERSGDAVAPFERIHPEGVFALSLPGDEPFSYRLRERSASGVRELHDPYRYPPLLGEIDVWLLAEGRHRKLYEVLGAHVRTIGGGAGVVCGMGPKCPAGQRRRRLQRVGRACTRCAFAASAASGRFSFPVNSRGTL